LFLSDRAHIDFDLHHAVDGLEEIELGGDSLGTTKKGIGPTFSCKATRNGCRLADIFDHELLATKLHRMAAGYSKRYGGLLKYDVDEELARFKQYSEKLAEFVIDEVPLMRDAKNRGLNMVVEGAQAAMLDNTYGTYPFVTSSNCSVGGILSGITLGWNSIKEVIGVVKAYTTRVGAGPFPTEQTNAYGQQLQEVGKEVGVTTGRLRRTGHLDLVIAKYSHDINGFTAINLTKLDVLDSFEEIHVAVAYSNNGTELESFPASLSVLENVEIKYETFPGWKAKTSGLRKFGDLPLKAQNYVEFIEKYIGVPIKYIGTGPAREDIIYRHGAIPPS
jgi:adenylosuccinate synthase